VSKARERMIIGLGKRRACEAMGTAVALKGQRASP
jgi:hypothetical protein